MPMHRRDGVQREFRDGEPVRVIGKEPFTGIFRGLYDQPDRRGPTLAVVAAGVRGEVRVAVARLRKISRTGEPR